MKNANWNKLELYAQDKLFNEGVPSFYNHIIKTRQSILRIDLYIKNNKFNISCAIWDKIADEEKYYDTLHYNEFNEKIHMVTLRKNKKEININEFQLIENCINELDFQLPLNETVITLDGDQHSMSFGNGSCGLVCITWDGNIPKKFKKLNNIINLIDSFILH